MEMITSADASLPSFLERDDADMLYTDDIKERDETFIYIFVDNFNKNTNNSQLFQLV